MAETTNIAWCDSTANLWTGCTKVSAACDNCYAEELMSIRYKRVGWGARANRVYVKQGWKDIRKWQRAAAKNGGIDPILGRKRRIFINSLADVLDNHKSVIWRPEFWDLVRECPDLIFILVTKRPQNLLDMKPAFWGEIADRIWLIVTAEDQVEYSRRVGALERAFGFMCRPRVIGLSCEPLLGALRVTSPMINWIIIGGESGTKARSMHGHWVNDIISDGRRLGAAVFFKQMSQKMNPKYGDYSTFPPNWQIREFPR